VGVSSGEQPLHRAENGDRVMGGMLACRTFFLLPHAEVQDPRSSIIQAIPRNSMCRLIFYWGCQRQWKERTLSQLPWPRMGLGSTAAAT
jgi:hypothetical protein